MKWLIPTIFGSLVALAVSFPRADEEVTAPETPSADAKDESGTATVGKSAPQPESRGLAEDASLSSKPASASGGLTTGDVDDTFEIYRLQHSNAIGVSQILKKMYPREANEVVVDGRTNSLIIRKGAGGPFLSAAIEKLDVPAPENSRTKRPPSGKRRDPNLPSSAPGMMPGSGSATSSMLAAMAGHPNNGAADDGQEYERYEASCQELAKNYRVQQQATPTDQKKLAELKAELSGAVHAAFYARQTYQRAQAAQLRERLAQIEQHISQRGQLANEIIERRVDELLQPEKQWEPDTASTERSAPPTGSAAASSNRSATDAADDGGAQNRDPNLGWSTDYYRSLMSSRETGRPLLIYFYAVNSPQCRALEDHFLKNSDVRKFVKERLDAVSVNVNSAEGKELYDQYGIRSIPTLHFVDPAGTALLKIEGLPQGNSKAFLSELHEIAVRKDVSKPEMPSGNTPTMNSNVRMTPDLSADPRQAVLNADNAVIRAQAEIAQAKAALAQAETLNDALQDAYRKGAVSQKEFLATRFDVERNRAVVTKAVNDLDAGERQLQLAREFLDGQIKIAELELHQAESRLDVASKDEARALSLAAKNAIAKEQLDAAVAAREQAQIQVKRAATILGLYKKPLPGRPAPASDKPATESGAASGSKQVPGSSDTPGKGSPPRSNKPGE